MFAIIIKVLSRISKIIEKKIIASLGVSGFFIYLLRVFYNYDLLQIKQVNNLKLIEDSSNKKIHISRINRLRKYKHGIDLRLVNLQREYNTHKINLNTKDCIIDIGANIGEFGLFWLKKGHNVIAFEPETLEFDALKQNLPDCNVYPIGLWKKDDTLKFYHKNESGDSSLFEVDDFNSCSEINVKTLDSFDIKDPIGLIKIESEGAEPEIIEGGKLTIKRSKYVAVDVGRERGLKSESTLLPVINQLTDLGFKLIDFNSVRLCIVLINKSKIY